MQSLADTRPSAAELFDVLLCLRRSQEAIRKYQDGVAKDARIWLDADQVVDSDAAGICSRLLDRADGWRGLDYLRANGTPLDRRRVEYEIQQLLHEGSSESWWLPAPAESDCWAVSFDGEWWTVPEWIERWRPSQPADAATE
ncbi:MAG TPA: hypothetical protein VGE52_02585 [Pirellulales bacterium]